MFGPVEDPELYEQTPFGQMFRHPAFGLVSVSRIQQQAHLFGSQVSHTGYVRVCVYRADLRKQTHGEEAMGHHAPLFEFAMTEAQWVGLVAGMGGPGVPCTLAHIPGGEATQVPRLPRPLTAEERLGEQVKDTFEQSEASAAAAREKVLGIVEGRLPKSMMAEFSLALDSLSGVSKRSRDYHHQRLAESKESMVHEAKVEIEALAQAFVRTLGLQSAQQLGAALSNPEVAARLLLGGGTQDPPAS